MHSGPQDSEALRPGRLRCQAGADDLLHVLNLQARQLNTNSSWLAFAMSGWPPASRCTWRPAAG